MIGPGTNETLPQGNSIYLSKYISLRILVELISVSLSTFAGLRGPPKQTLAIAKLTCLNGQFHTKGLLFPLNAPAPSDVCMKDTQAPM